MLSMPNTSAMSMWTDRRFRNTNATHPRNYMIDTFPLQEQDPTLVALQSSWLKTHRLGAIIG